MSSLNRVLALMAATVVVVGLAATATGSTSRKITLTAKKFEWIPPTITVEVGESIELILESEDVKHGFSCRDLGIKSVKFKKGEPVTVTFSADKPGTYEFKCAHFCGTGHRRMKGEIIVHQ